MKQLSAAFVTIFAIGVTNSAFGASCPYNSPELQQEIQKQVNQWAKERGAKSFVLSGQISRAHVSEATFSFVGSSTYTGNVKIDEATCTLIEGAVNNSTEYPVQ